MKGFYQTYFDILESANACLKDRRIIPCLILVYSAIDSFSALANKTNSKGRNVFKSWVKEWMLSKYPLPCNETDLYAARCGIIHTHKSLSELSEKEEARELSYSWGNADNKVLQISLDELETNKIALKIEDLIHSFRNGMADCLSEIEKDIEWSNLFKEKASSVLLSIDTLKINN